MSPLAALAFKLCVVGDTGLKTGWMRCRHGARGEGGAGDLLEEDGLARPVVDVEELGMPIGELRGDQVDDDVECAGQLRIRAGDEAQGLPRIAGVEVGLDWSGRAIANRGVQDATSSNPGRN